MNKQNFVLAGKESFNCTWSDEELNNEIEVLECVLAYLRERGDSNIIAYSLNRDLESFKQMKLSRNERTKTNLSG